MTPFELERLGPQAVTDRPRVRAMVSGERAGPSGEMPGGQSAHLHAVYPAQVQAVPSARHEVAAYAEAMGVVDDRLEAVRLAVSEAVSNAVQHAYRDKPGVIRVSATVVSGTFQVTVGDDGLWSKAPNPTRTAATAKCRPN